MTPLDKKSYKTRRTETYHYPRWLDLDLYVDARPARHHGHGEDRGLGRNHAPESDPRF